MRRGSDRKGQWAPTPLRNSLVSMMLSVVIVTSLQYATSSSRWSCTRPSCCLRSFGQKPPRLRTRTIGSGAWSRGRKAHNRGGQRLEQYHLSFTELLRVRLRFQRNSLSRSLDMDYVLARLHNVALSTNNNGR